MKQEKKRKRKRKRRMGENGREVSVMRDSQSVMIEILLIELPSREVSQGMRMTK